MNNQSEIKQNELDKAVNIINRIMDYYRQRIVGQEELCQSLLLSLMVNGHILLESVPGLAKTTAAKVITTAVSGDFSRIQCTPDLLPSDIIGGQIFNYSTSSFETKLGPVFANFVLLDEINRSSPKTQSAMLEAMQERQTTIGGFIYKLPRVFVVIATQNPIEQEGTYPLPEAQLDRFMFNVRLEYPPTEEEIMMVKATTSGSMEDLKPVITSDRIIELQEIVRRVPVSDRVIKYAVAIAEATRPNQPNSSEFVNNYITWGAGPRASQYLILGAKARAVLQGRYYVACEDIRALASSVLRHRIMLNFSAEAEGITPDSVIEKIVKTVLEPVG